MKRILLMAVMAVIGWLGCMAQTEADIPYRAFLEEGKVWWYQGTYKYVDMADYDNPVTYDFAMGFILRKATEENPMGKAMECWIIDENNQDVVDAPIALLVETDDRKVYLTPYVDDILDRYKSYSDGKYSPQLEVLETRCNFGYYSEDPDGGLFSKDDYPMLLYDFGWTGGSSITISYPWRENAYYIDQMFFHYYKGGDLLRLFTRNPYELCVIYPRYIEAVGCEDYDEEDIFLCPFYLDYPYYGNFKLVKKTPHYVSISVESFEWMAIRRKNGKFLYKASSMMFEPWNSSDVDEVVATAPVEDDVVYDLMGQRVINPVSGTIYIRNGKKFVMK